MKNGEVGRARERDLQRMDERDVTGWRKIRRMKDVRKLVGADHPRILPEWVGRRRAAYVTMLSYASDVPIVQRPRTRPFQG